MSQSFMSIYLIMYYYGRQNVLFHKICMTDNNFIDLGSFHFDDFDGIDDLIH